MNTKTTGPALPCSIGVWLRGCLVPWLLPLLLAACTQHADTADTSPASPDLTEVLTEDQARAGLLTEAHDGAFIGGTAGESTVGDLLLYNDRARFVVRGIRPGHFYVGEPGSIIDMDIVRPADQPDSDGLDELVTMLDFGRVFSAESITVLDDGSDGGAALAEATGTDASIEFFEGSLEVEDMLEPRGVQVTQTFRLEPGQPLLEVTTTVLNTTGDDLSLDIIDAGMVDLATHQDFIPGTGFDGTAPDGGRQMLAMVARRNGQAWAIFRDDGDLDEGLSALGDALDMVVAQGDTLDLASGEEASYTRLIGVAEDLATLESWRRQRQDLPTGYVEGTVSESGSGEALAGARVFITDADGNPLTVAFTHEDGSYRIASQPGDYWLVVVADGNNEQMDFPEGHGDYGIYARESANELALRAFSDPSSVTPVPQADGYGRSDPLPITLQDTATTRQDVNLPPPAVLRVQVSDQYGVDMPAVVDLLFPDGTEDPSPPDERLGENRPRDGVRKTAWLRDGQMDIPVVAGTYDVQAYRGFRHELDRQDSVELISGQTTTVALVLEEAYQTPGWISADLHVHASPSLDGKCTVEERLLTVATSDLQVHISTDHDHINTYAPAATAMGLDPWLLTLPGDEVSPTLRGHFNAYPVDPDPLQQNGGAPRWWEYFVSTTELFAIIRDRIGDEAVLQVNHGRGSGMFAYSDFDAATGEPGDPDHFCAEFDTMEILNSKGYDDAQQLQQDWCAMLDLGYRPTAVGVSDSHTRLPGPGKARTYIASLVDEPGALDRSRLVADLKAGHAQVTGGPFIELEAESGDISVGPGDTITVDGQLLLHVTVKAPSWMPVDEIRLYGAGCELLETLEPDSPQAPLWFDGEFTVNPQEDGYYFVEVEGSTDMGPVWPGGHPYAMTNAVFVELQ